MLKINEVKIKKINNGDLLCYASILIDNSIVIDGIKLLQGENGRYIIMPVRKLKGVDTKRNYSYPINNETREKILQEISNKYDEEIENTKED